MADETATETTTETTDEQTAKQTEPQGTDWKAEARKWEDRAKANKKALDAATAELEKSKASKAEAGNPKPNDGVDYEERARRAEARVKELEADQRRSQTVMAVAKETGVSPDLLLRMTGSTEEEIRDNAKLASEALKSKWPDVRDNGGGKAPRMSKKQILEIEDQSERVKAIAKNPDLFK